MGKLTYVIEQTRKISDTKYRVVLDGLVVHASHPEQADKLIRFESKDDKEALQTFQKVIQKYFHPRDGWTLKEKKPGVADLTPWGPPPPSKEEVESQKKNQRRRQLGWAAEDGIMVLDLKRQKTVNDLEIALDGGGANTIMSVLTSGEDDIGAGFSLLSGRLLEGAMPKLTEIHIDSPWETLTRSAQLPLSGLGLVFEKRRNFTVIGAVGDIDVTASFAQPKLTTLRLLSPELAPGAIDRIARMGAEDLKTLQLGLCVDGDTEGAADPAAEAALLKLPFAQYDELTVTGVTNVAALLEALLKAGRQLPKHTRIDGGNSDDARLIAALLAWKEKAPGTLSLGDALHVAAGPKVQPALEAAAVETFVSPFDSQQRDPKMRELWQVFA